MLCCVHVFVCVFMCCVVWCMNDAGWGIWVVRVCVLYYYLCGFGDGRVFLVVMCGRLSEVMLVSVFVTG